jgi:D-lactate dehydrogenase
LDGSLKAEHGTGRNVAPYVEMEWGAKATSVMWEVKKLFDAEDLLNPGVVLNKNNKVHVQNLKPMPVAHGVVDTCMECGFCESACPSGHVTLTPRQRIVATRELARLDMGKTADDAAKAAEMRTIYDYQALDTCAADGMCAEKCPVSINTGRMVKDLRARSLPPDSLGHRAGAAALTGFGPLMGAVPPLLNLVDTVHGVLGTRVMSFAASLVGPLVGLHWHPYLARGAAPLSGPKPLPATLKVEKKKVVYFATCVSRSMGPARGDSESAAIHDKVMSVLAKAGYEVVLPAGLPSACCGLVFDSRGLPAQGDTQMRALEAALTKASERGRHPILLDTSPCVMRLKDYITDPALKGAIFEPAEFASKHLLPRLAITPQKESVAMHVPCSGKKMKVDKHFESVMLACAPSVTVSPVPCCGMAGDRGLRYPEISGGGTASAVASPPGPAMVLTRVNGKTVTQAGTWPADVKSACSEGYSTSRTCEMSLSKQTETHFKSLFYLLDKVSAPLETAKA